MTDCTFSLNSKDMSTLRCGASSFPAFSGFGPYANRPEHACRPTVGAIPPGTYYILDRQSGGLLGRLRDLFNNRNDWFALYAIDSNIDDSMFCNKV